MQVESDGDRKQWGDYIRIAMKVANSVRCHMGGATVRCCLGVVCSIGEVQ